MAGMGTVRSAGTRVAAALGGGFSNWNKRKSWATGAGHMARAHAWRCVVIAGLGLFGPLQVQAATTGTWTTSATGGTATANGVTVTWTDASSAATYSTDFLNATNFWSNPYGAAVNGNASLSPTFNNIGVAGYSKTITVTFSKAVDNPVLHVDRLGGGTDLLNTGVYTPTSTVWTLSGASASGGPVTITQLAGNGAFQLSGNSFQRSIVGTTDGIGECTSSATGSSGTACGSVRFNGTGITSLTFTVTSVGGTNALTGTSGDGLEFAWSIKGATLQVRKQSLGGTQNFSFTSTNGFSGTLNLNTGTSNPITGPVPAAAIPNNSQAITVVEGNPGGAWTLQSASCQDQNGNTVASSQSGGGNRTLTIAAAAYQANQDILCTFVNANPPTLTLVKVVSGGSNLATDWTLTATRSGGGTIISGVTGSAAVTGASVTTGTYTLSESATPTGYAASLYSCSKNGGAAVSSNSVTIAGGDIVTCTITNRRLTADLSITKSNGVTSVVSGSTTTYTIRVTNSGPDAATGAILKDPAAAGLTKTAVACSGSPGQCTAGTTPTIAQLQDTVNGYALPTLTAGQFYEITVTCSVN